MTGEVVWEGRDPSAYDLVEKALQRKKAARNSDEFMLWYIRRYLVTEDGEKTADLNRYQAFKAGPPVGTLLRKRREIQNTEGRLLPTKPAVAKQRRLSYEKIRDFYSGDEEVMKEYRLSTEYTTAFSSDC